ncbi:MAG TPA: ATPase, T2SS/T4P/T4SS family [Kofleriaceae bacterium]|jgi:twitching motility protein PilT
MSKLDTYLRSIEKFGATGATLISNQPITLKFPTGDRNATQVVPHEQLVAMVREIATTAALDAVDKQRPARFDYESGGFRYQLTVAPRVGAWQLDIVGAGASQGVPQPVGAQPSRPVARAQSAPVAGDEMEIERGQYDMPNEVATAPASSGSTFLDGLTTGARGQRATDIFLAAGAPVLVRANGELVPSERTVVDGDQLARELGVVAPADARAALIEGKQATFAYNDGAGRVRATLTRDRRGPGAALRLLHGEPPALERLSLGDEVTTWLGGQGLIVIAGASGAGKTTLLAALVRNLGERRRAVVAIEDPIELVQTGPSISQREVGAHVPSAAAGVEAAMREGADAIVVGTVTSAETAAAVVAAVAGGHLVLATVTAPGLSALDRLLEYLPSGDRGLAGRMCREALLGTITASLARSGGRAYGVVPGGA